MKYKFAFFSVFVWALLILAGCLKNESEIQEVVKSSEQISIVMEGQGISEVLEIEEHEIVEIKIYKAEAHGTIGKTLINKLTNRKDYINVLEALKTASEIPGILNTATPDYDFVIKLNNNERFAFHFWISEKEETSMVVNVKNTATGYIVSKELTKTLLHYIN